jgi:hypothetical protein
LKKAIEVVMETLRASRLLRRCRPPYPQRGGAAYR